MFLNESRNKTYELLNIIDILKIEYQYSGFMQNILEFITPSAIRLHFPSISMLLVLGSIRLGSLKKLRRDPLSSETYVLVRAISA